MANPRPRPGIVERGATSRPEVHVVPLTPERWDDLVTVFSRGDCSRCWCMYWRLPPREFAAARGKRAKELFHARVEHGFAPGLIAYADGHPAGWVQVGPRADVPIWNAPRRLSAATADAPADDPHVWGISCFVISPQWRGRGIATKLLVAALDWARNNGARVLDACPVEPTDKRDPSSLYHGIASMFRRAGFTEVARRRTDRPLMRLELS